MDQRQHHGPRSLEQEIEDMPLVDEDAPEVSDDEAPGANESISSGIGSPSGQVHPHEDGDGDADDEGEGGDHDLSPDEVEEKERLIQQIMELQNTLDGELISI